MYITYKGRTYKLTGAPTNTIPHDECEKWQDAAEAKAEATEIATGENVELYFWSGKLHGIVHDESAWNGPTCEECVDRAIETIYAKDYEQDDFSLQFRDDLEIAILERTLNGEAVRVVYPEDDYRDDEIYEPIDTEAIARYLGADLWEMLKANDLADGEAGYVWWQNISEGDMQAIEETIEMHNV